MTKEIAAFANTKLGGLVFYGVEDDGTITVSDKRKQELDQSLQNSVRNAISPSLTINIEEKDILGYQIIIIQIPAWNKKDVYHYEGRVYIRRGTNVFMAKPEDSKKLQWKINCLVFLKILTLWKLTCVPVRFLFFLTDKKVYTFRIYQVVI